MHSLPTPILGNVTALTITSPDLEVSLAYYQQLGFSLVMRSDWPFPWVQVSDGALLIMLRQGPRPYIALTYYTRYIEKIVGTLEEKGIVFTQRPKKTDAVKRYLFTSPDGLHISLVSIIDGFSQPPGPDMLRMQPQDHFDPAKYVNNTCGMYGEFAHPVADLEYSIAFWEKLGFSAVSKFSDPYPWAIATDGLAVVGLHQALHFTYPAITYFAADMPKKLAALKKKGLENYKEDSPGNATLTTPEQQHLFLFSMGGGDAGKKEISQPVIETERLLLRELNPEIMDQLFTTYNDEDIISFLGLPGHAELATEKNNWKQGLTTFRLSFRKFLLQDKATGEIIGKAGFHTWHLPHRRAELGYKLTKEDRRGKGLMTEALEAIIAYGFGTMGLNRIEAFVGKNNVPSLKIMKAFGFTQEGLLREHYNNNGTIEGSICFSLLKSEYP